MRSVLRPPRLYALLGAVLAVQIALCVVLFWPRDASLAGGDPLFPDFVPDQVVELTITDDAGSSMHLTATGGGWTMPDAGDYPVLEDRVRSLLDSIAALAKGRLVTRTEPSHRALQVADDAFLRRVVFGLADGSSGALYLGSSPRYGLTHVRSFGRDEVYLTDDLLSWDVGTSPASWIDTRYLAIPREEVTRLTVTNSNGALEFTQGDSGAEGHAVWTMAGLGDDEEIGQASLDSLVNQALSVTVAEPIGLEERAAFGLGDPAAVVTVETADDTITLLVGGADPDGRYYVVKASSSPYYIYAAQWNLSGLVDYAREDLLEPTATPATEDDAAATPASE